MSLSSKPMEKNCGCTQAIAVNNSKYILGIDIGTTGISAVLIDVEHNTVLKTVTVTNDSKLQTEDALSEYDAEWIVKKTRQMIDELIEVYPNVVSIGITGQMHGIVYTDVEGNAVSPLYNWQDGRGNRSIGQERTYCEEIKLRTGYTVFSGYGFATLFYNKLNHQEPQSAVSFCTIMDYLAMNLTGESSPVIHPTNAASLGLFDIRQNCFDESAVEKLGLGHLVLPTIAKEGDMVGYYRGIPIAVAIGDNQASFYGSVKSELNTALVNFGTGSQISMVTVQPESEGKDLEVRPYLFGKYLICGSALCGGKAYAILEKFFSEYAGEVIKTIGSPCEMMTGLAEERNLQAGSQYEIMNRLAQKAYDNSQPLKVSTRFCGTRREPDLRGCISGIDDINFTPGNLILGVLQGMTDELKAYYSQMQTEHISELAASGNAVQRNPVLQILLQNTFGLKVKLTSGREEAATGAALYAGVSKGIISSEQAAEIIT